MAIQLSPDTDGYTVNGTIPAEVMPYVRQWQMDTMGTDDPDMLWAFFLNVLTTKVLEHREEQLEIEISSAAKVAAESASADTAAQIAELRSELDSLKTTHGV